MPMREVRLTETLDRFVETRVEAGTYEDASEVMREALRALEREEREYDAKLAAIRAAIAEGEASGVFDGDPFAGAWAAAGLPETER